MYERDQSIYRRTRDTLFLFCRYFIKHSPRCDVKDVSRLLKPPNVNSYKVIMSPKATLIPSQRRDGSDDGSEDGSDHEEATMIGKGRNPRGRKWRGNLKTTIVILGLLLFASLAANVALLSYSLQSQDLDAISVKHTSEYCR